MTSTRPRGVVTTVVSDGATRTLAATAFAGALVQIIGGVVETIDRVPPGDPGFVWRTSVMGVAYLMLVCGVIGLARSDAARPSRSSQLGLWSAGLGWLLSVVAQFVLQIDFDLAEAVLFPIATVMTGVGMTVFGIGVVRARRWRGWRRATPLICGLVPFLVIFPVFAVHGGPVFLVLSVNGVAWALLALALLTSARPMGHTPGQEA